MDAVSPGTRKIANGAAYVIHFNILFGKAIFFNIYVEGERRRISLSLSLSSICGINARSLARNKEMIEMNGARNFVARSCALGVQET